MNQNKPYSRLFCVGRSSLTIVLGALIISHTALSQAIFKCGSMVQDKPCENVDVQKRFSATTGSFSVEQVDGKTDIRCAKLAALGEQVALASEQGKSKNELLGMVDRTSDQRARQYFVDYVQNLKEPPRRVRKSLETDCTNTLQNLDLMVAYITNYQANTGPIRVARQPVRPAVSQTIGIGSR